ncbi:hypothetical protein AGMMS50249_1480 [candidate division SR1 bacterium]|nr:hypothetical protein AGMMS50249_1480 [candidate division SR1 bacterium]
MTDNTKAQSFTADFIAEGLDQTRGRFRSLHILNHAITGNNAAKNIVVNGLILAEDGKKMSKSLKNYPDPQDLIQKRGGDSFRLYCLSSPVVRAEPMKFNEKGVEQAFKDFTIPLQNVFNFFETYAKIDQWKSDGTEVYFATGKLEGEMLTRINPEITIEKYDLKIENPVDDYDKYFDIIENNKGKRILIVGGGQGGVIELPTYKISNDLDKWILAELHKMMIEVDTHLQNYILDEATKSAMDFMDKLTNRRLRRSRRRFWSNGMNEDKNSAFSTLFHVLKRYLQILAPFTPFITEYLWLKLADFEEKEENQSIHLSSRPIASKKYINQTLIDETAIIRKIIKLALFVRAKNKIAVKQPLQTLQVKID